jgi:hypothetical protein
VVPSSMISLKGVIRNLILFLDFKWFVIIYISCRIHILLRLFVSYYIGYANCCIYII